MSKINITPEVRVVLENSAIDATSVKLPSTPLDRLLCMAVNKVLEAGGGKWNRSAKAHIFPSDPREILGLALVSNVIVDKAKAHKKATQAFYTPIDAACLVVRLADVEGRDVLEPSAGRGALAKACRVAGADIIWCRDIDIESVNTLKQAGFPTASLGDFLETCAPEETDRYERIVMNPPFTRKADAKHVRHAFSHWLSKGGLLTSIVCDDGQDRADLAKIDPSFRIVHRFPSGTFKESGTNIATLVIQLSK